MIRTLIAIIVLTFSVVIQAQDENMKQRMDELKAQKVAFFTEKINLDSETAQKFWPLYNEFEKGKFEFFRKNRELTKQMWKVDKGEVKLSEKDYEKLADSIAKLRFDHAKLQQEYHEKYKKVLTPEQLVRFYVAEDQFNRDMLRKMHRKGPRPNEEEKE